MRFSLPRLMITTVLVGSLLSLAPGAGAVGEGHMGLFYARISPDGSQAAFNMGGDIWVADLETGECARVTDHVAHDHHPVWFPDGARIAFSSNRDGNDDVYSIPAIGGTPTRHTWHGTADIAMDVSPDGERILFRSWRRMYAVDLYEVDTKGGLPRPITNDSGLNLESRYSFDGNSIAVCRGAASWVRREYHGSGDSDLYVMDRDGKNMRWVENRYDGIDFWPTFGPNGEYIFFVSDRELGCENVYRIPSGGGPAERLTSFRTRPVQFLSVARTGRMCFVQDFRLWTMDGPEATPRAVNLRCGTEPKHSQEARLDVAGQVSEIEVGPLGLHLAVIARGELYITPLHDPDEPEPIGDARYWESIRLTKTPAREQEVTWHPDGDKVALVSDKDGNQEIYEINLRTREWSRLTRTPEDESAPDYSPDGKLLAFYRSRTDMVVMELETGKEHTVARAEFVYVPYTMPFEWSPDSRWIAYTVDDAAYFSDVYIMPIGVDGTAGEAVNITLHHDNDLIGGWASDGKSVHILSNRGTGYGLEGYAWWNEGYGLYSMDLKRVPPPRSDVLEFPEQEPDEEAAEEQTENEGAIEEEIEEAEVGEEEGIKVEIDFERIDERTRLVSPTRGTIFEAALSPDCKTFVYESNALGKSALWSVPFEGGSATHIADTPAGITDLEWLPDGRGLIYLTAGRVKFWEKGGGRVMDVPTFGRLDVDLVAERQEMIRETGRLLKNHFYDPEMHGVDWDSVVELYAPLVEQAATPEEFELLMDMLFGELQASHLACYTSTSDEGIGANPAILGLDFDPTTEGPGLRVTSVWPRGPADYEETRIEPGEWVLKINGTEVSPARNYWSLLDDAGDRTTVLTVASDQAGKDSREVRLGPSRYTSGGGDYPWYQGMYLAWAEEKRAIVEEASGGRIGYIHLRHMMGGPLEDFARELFAENSDKEALILDVRWNSGGNIHEHLLDILSRPQFGWSANRNRELIPQPARRWDRPIVLLTNERSFSDAEIFPQGFRTLGLGTIMGETTFGGVIGTVDIPLIDNVTYIRIPRVGWYTVDRENLENFGVEPDIRIEQDLNHTRDGIDDQLNAAIRYLLDQLED